MKVILNPDYTLRMMKGRAIIYSTSIFETSYNGEVGWESTIHPLHGMILSFFNGTEYNEILRNISNHFDISENRIKEFTDNLLNNKSNYTWHLEGNDFFFPKFCLITAENKDVLLTKHQNYKPEMFNYDELDLKRKRHPFPLDIHLMLNTECSTNCIYCYADRRHVDDKLAIKRILELIKEAKFYNARSFELTGGDIFLYKDWSKILIELYKNEFKPLLSTKTPLKESTVNKLSKIGVKKIQFSLDSISPLTLENILQIKNGKKYLENVKKSFSILESYNILVDIHTIITNSNNNILNTHGIYSFLREFSNINEWRVDNAHSTLYKSEDENNDFLIDKNIYSNIIEFLKIIKENNEHKFRIFFDFEIEEEHFENLNSYNNKKMLCSGNYSSIVILPDGKVTICEELCWQSRFILGDITSKSISQVWNSATALNLYYINQSIIQENSPCRHCYEFEKCHEFKHVCWLNIIKAYGEEKWDYPDPLCPSAPKVNNSFIKQF